MCFMCHLFRFVFVCSGIHFFFVLSVPKNSIVCLVCVNSYLAFFYLQLISCSSPLRKELTIVIISQCSFLCSRKSFKLNCIFYSRLLFRLSKKVRNINAGVVLFIQVNFIKFFASLRGIAPWSIWPQLGVHTTIVSCPESV